MEFFDVIRKRRSIRQFTGERVPDDVLIKIVDAGRMAASGMNYQPWEFIIVTNSQVIGNLCFPDDHWINKAGALIAIVMDSESRWWMEDASAATQNILLASTASGYGACWIEGYTLRNEEKIRTTLRIPNERKLFTLIAIGVPNEQPIKEKKDLSDLLHWQYYQLR